MLETQADLFRQSKQKEYRQLALMLSAVADYKGHSRGLNSLINQLEHLLDSLNELDKEWERKFVEYHWALEIEYSFFIYDKKTHFSDDDLKCIAEALDGIEQMVKERIKRYEPYLDDAEYE